MRQNPDMELSKTAAENAATDVFRQHERQFATYSYVYPVVSRRSRGLSIGINLNPDKICNFDCIYCQVDRSVPGGSAVVDVERLRDELEQCLRLALSGEIFQLPKFRSTPAELRRLNDIAFSGDGEPTTCRNLDEIVAACAEIKDRLGAGQVKMVLITNASMFHRPRVKAALELLDRHQGEIWAKLDAGTEEYYRRVDRTTIPFQQILDNLLEAARKRPIVIQSLFMKVAGQPPSHEEIQAYGERLKWICRNGGQIRYVQIYTVARPPAEAYVSALSDAEVDAIRDQVVRITAIPAVSYYAEGPSIVTLDI